MCECLSNRPGFCYLSIMVSVSAKANYENIAKGKPAWDFDWPHDKNLVNTNGDDTLSMGILQIMVNLSPDPTRPGGSELPTFSYGGEGIPRVLKQYRFSPHRYIFPIRWSNQLNQSERRIYAPLTWITTDPGNGLESARRQAIAWTNFYLIIN